MDAKSLHAAAGTRASLDASEALGALKDKREAGREVGVRFASGRRFTFEDGVWRDQSYRAGMKEERLRAYSDRYFALLAAHPELAQVLALGERVVVVVGATAYRIEPPLPR